MKQLANLFIILFFLSFLTACGINTESDTNNKDIEEAQSQQSQPKISQENSLENLPENNDLSEMESMDAIQAIENKALKKSQRSSPQKITPLSIEEDDMPRLD